MGPNPSTCFWGGWGGSLVVNDLDANLTVAYVMNRMGEGTVGDVRGAGIVLAALRWRWPADREPGSLSRTRCLAFAAVQLLERDAFLAQLDGELGEAGQGHGRLVLVCGEAGIGKTALVDAFSARLSGREQVVWGACDAVTPARPVRPAGRHRRPGRR